MNSTKRVKWKRNFLKNAMNEEDVIVENNDDNEAESIYTAARSQSRARSSKGGAGDVARNAPIGSDNATFDETTT